MHCPVRSAATCLRVRTPVATLHQRGRAIGMRHQARGVDSAKGISVSLLGSDPSCLFPPDCQLGRSQLAALLRNPTRRTTLTDSLSPYSKTLPPSACSDSHRGALLLCSQGLPQSWHGKAARSRGAATLITVIPPRRHVPVRPTLPGALLFGYYCVPCSASADVRICTFLPAIRSEMRGTASLPWSCSAGWRLMGLINRKIKSFMSRHASDGFADASPLDAFFCFLDWFATSWRGAMHCPVRSVATCLEVRTPMATLHQRGKDLGMRYHARGAGSAKGISVFLLGSDPGYLFPPDS